MVQDEVQKALEMFTDGSGFGDPEARRNAELRLQAALAQQQSETAARLNLLNLLLVLVGLMQVVVLAFQVWGK
ncbi:MAG: hypothetical protein ACP5XB_27715 [Isosphaeraceae bacterium]